MDWYLLVWRKYAEFEGRSRRTEYWMFILFNTLILLGLAIVAGIASLIARPVAILPGIPAVLYILAAIVPSLAVTVRRLHDSGKSGWWLLLFFAAGLIPIVGFISGIVQIVIMCLDSEPGTNRFGPNPKFSEMAGGASGSVSYSAPVYYPQPPQPVPAQPQPMAASKFCSRCGAATGGASTICASCGAQA